MKPTASQANMESYRLETKDTKYHKCDLELEAFDIVSKFVEGGPFVLLRRKLKRYTMISDKHPQTTAYAPSINRIRQEEKSHLILHYYMIHPLSMLSLHFELLVSFMFLCHYMIAPLIFTAATARIKTGLMIPINILYLLIIVYNFMTGYYNRSQNSISMEWSVVAKHYITTYFFIDLLSFPMDVIRWAGVLIDDVVMNMYIAPLLIILRYGRFIWISQVLRRYRKYIGISSFAFNFFQMMLNFVVGLELAIFILYKIMTNVREYHVRNFLHHAIATLKMIFMVSYGQNISRELSIIFILLGFMFHLMVLVQTRDLWFRFFSEENQQTNIYRSVDAYMHYRALPTPLRKRIHHYMEFKYQRHFYKDSVIRRTSSSFLRKEILLAATKESIQKVDMFSKMPADLLKQVRSILVQEIFLPGDVIIRAGTPGRCMFFLLYGTVEVTNAEGDTICYLRDGTHFGEVALVIKIARVATVTAVTACELFKLERKNFTDVVSKYPKLWRHIEKMAIERIAEQMQTSTTVLTTQLGSLISNENLSTGD
ncbi:unnamed protein product [Ceutorhynchus assimilis]|uniref:Cyclic nucleotide-binding domain-containing protein n=1 Tax=Ceutorhynchus assimilis TaxID=467358 RepID=A0A9P0DD24_9CUCU|nr:unnamed protein product [Ceutorhynchus assimilis]